MPYMLIEGIGWQNHFVQGTGPGTGPDVNKCLEEIENHNLHPAQNSPAIRTWILMLRTNVQRFSWTMSLVKNRTVK